LVNNQSPLLASIPNIIPIIKSQFYTYGLARIDLAK
jgi:hypothetical protein